MSKPKRAPTTSLTNPFASAEDLKVVTEALLIRHGEQDRCGERLQLCYI